MVRKHTLYQLATVVWFVAAAGSLVLVISGQAEPYVTPERIPGGPMGGFGIMAGVIIAGVVVIGRLETRAWKKMGRKAGLEPERGLNLLGRPAMTGTVRGRPVRVDSYKVSSGGSGESGGSSTTYTLVEAELAEPVERGFFFGKHGGESSHILDDLPNELREKRVGDEFYAMGDIPAETAAQLHTPRVSDTFRDPNGAGTVVVGDPTDVIMSAVPDSGGGLMGSFTGIVESKLRDKAEFDASMASHGRKGLILSAEKLDKQLAAVVAVAEAYERAEAGTRRGTAAEHL